MKEQEIRHVSLSKVQYDEKGKPTVIPTFNLCELFSDDELKQKKNIFKRLKTYLKYKFVYKITCKKCLKLGWS